MRRLFCILSVLTPLFLSACHSEIPSGEGTSTGEGAAAVTFRLPSVTRSADTDGYPWKDDCDIRIYKKTEALGKELIRHYFTIDEMPGEIWLLQGSYAIAVSLGNKAVASFDRPSYYGEADFDIEAGRQTAVTVSCGLLNTMVEIVVDASVKQVFDEALRVGVMPGNFDDAAENAAETLVFEDSGRGYFLLPENGTDLGFCFLGQSSRADIREKIGPEGVLHEHFTKHIEAGKAAGYLYRLQFSWSKDAEAHLDWEFRVVCDPSEADSEEFVPVNPAPKPVISGEGWDISQPCRVSGELRYRLRSSASELKTVRIACEDQSFEVDLTAPSADGIVFEADAEKGLFEGTLMLEKAFFDRFTGGEHALSLTVVARNEGSAGVVSTLLLPGTRSLTASDPWQEEGEFSAWLFDETVSSVRIRYREAGEELWQEADAVPAGEDHLWTATGKAIGANTAFEYQLVADGVPVGAARTTVTADGPQVYNAGFEIWTMQGRVLCPYTDLDTDQWWDSGNHGSASMIGNITTNVNDPRPDSPGSVSARLASRSTLGILAAGNIYLGKFVGTKQTTKGVIRFGHAFDFTYRPKALRFWFKGTVGTVDVLSSGTPDLQRGDQDRQNLYILLCDIPGPHIVDTSNPASFLDLSDGIEEISYYSGDVAAITTTNCLNDATGPVVAWGVWENDATVDEWTLQTVELHYTRHADTRPCWLMITAAANKYGDYYSGCSSNVLCLDDIELVY